MAASLVPSTFGRQLARFLRPCLMPSTAQVQGQRGVKRYMRKYLKELYNRRLIVGPEKLRHRSEFINWNYDAEVYAFGKRLGEEFSASSLKTAFTHRSYIEKEEARRAELGIDISAAPLGLNDNSELVQKGEKTASRFIKAYLRCFFPNMFEEAINAIHDELMSEESLSYIASHIGIGDLLLCSDFPPEDSTLSQSFLSVIGALETDQGVKKAEALVRDLVLAQLVGKDLTEMWNIVNPMGLLMAVLDSQGRGPPEARLQWQSGQRTVMSVYQVGIYSDQKLIGQSAGERVTIAEEMAARDALNRVMGIRESHPPLAFRGEADQMELKYDQKNISAEELMQKYYQSQKVLQ